MNGDSPSPLRLTVTWTFRTSPVSQTSLALRPAVTWFRIYAPNRLSGQLCHYAKPKGEHSLTIAALNVYPVTPPRL